MIEKQIIMTEYFTRNQFDMYSFVSQSDVHFDKRMICFFK